MIYNNIINSGKKFFSVLIDPEFHSAESAAETARMASHEGADIILIGGSLTSKLMDDIVLAVKKSATCPVLLFPGSLFQISAKADGILLNSLISGRNPEYLIGNHVLISQFLRNSGMEIIPTGYIIIDGQHFSSVEYISNTRPIPSDKHDIIAATALAGEQLGMKLIYIEAGSGAAVKVGEKAIASVKQVVSIPVITGGGIRTAGDVRSLYSAGADGVVVGSAVEDDPAIIRTLARVKDEF